MAWTSLCELNELEEGQGKYVEIDGFQLAVFKHGEEVFVLDNYCPHAGGNLAGGMIEDGCAVCPWHFWSFRLADGQMPSAPGVGVPTYKTRLHPREDGTSLVQADLPMP